MVSMPPSNDTWKTKYRWKMSLSKLNRFVFVWYHDRRRTNVTDGGWICFLCLGCVLDKNETIFLVFFKVSTRLLNKHIFKNISKLRYMSFLSNWYLKIRSVFKTKFYDICTTGSREKNFWLLIKFSKLFLQGVRGGVRFLLRWRGYHFSIC